MKKKIMIVGLLVLILTLAFSTSVALADKPPTTVGEQIIVKDDGEEKTFSAGEPFYIQHGFISGFAIPERVGNGVALSKMILEVDGVEIDPDYITTDWGVYDHPETGEPWLVATKLFTFNFPDGLMTGDHTFTRRYFFTCQSYWNMGIPIECKNGAQLIEEPSMLQSIVVTFED